VGAPPAELHFQYSDRGKPHLEDHVPLEFNLSHSGEVALLAVTRIGPVGIDVERKRPLEDLLGLARSNFASGEYATLTALPEPERLDSFFQCWTRKEAYVKSVGEGLALSLGDFEVTCEPGEPARFLSLGGSSGRARSWYLHGFRPAKGYIGALALRGQPETLETWIWRRPRKAIS
jgi:4'-phosphopantetheinyl transferase